MKEEYISHLVCPDCAGELRYKQAVKGKNKAIESGTLQCSQCGHEFRIENYIPRFVPKENYANNFGFQWNLHSRTQYDSSHSAGISRNRFFEQTEWPEDLKGEIVLEVGSGSGRFTEPAASTGATIISTDYSNAVEANYASNGAKENVFIVQSDVYSLPFKKNYFDKIVCIGVLQHTPNPGKSFLCMPPYLKPGGRIAVDVYSKRWFTYLIYSKYWVRPFTRKMPSEKLYQLCSNHVDRMWPLSRLISRIPLGFRLNMLLLIPNYFGRFDLTDQQLKEWAKLDMFDMLSPQYDLPQSLRQVRNWLTEAGLTQIEVEYGWNGIEGRGVKPAS